MINKKKIGLFTLLLTLQFLLADNLILGNLIGVIEIVFVIYILIYKKSVNQAFYWHVFFMFASIEGTNLINGVGNPVYGYRTINLSFIPISFSNLIPIILILIYIFSNKKIFIQKKDILYKFIIFFFFLPLIFGVMRLAIRSYDFEFFINSLMHPFIYLLVYTLILQYISSVNNSIINLEELLVTALIGSVFSTNIASFLGVTSQYSSMEVMPTSNIILFSPFLIVLSIYLKKPNNIFVFLVGVVSIVNIMIFSASGKGILFSIIAILVWFYKIFSSKKKIIFSILLIFIIIISSFLFSKYFIQTNNVLLKAKTIQVLRLLDFSNWGTNFKGIPPSPRIRILEFVNIYKTHKKNILDLFIGAGFGGYFEDEGNYFNDMNLKGAFTDKQIELQQFVSPHESLNEIFLLTGFIGVFFWFLLLIKFSFYVALDNEYSFFSVIGVIFLVTLWNTFIILSYFCIIALAIVENKKYKLTNK